jgi:hypothetical protein
MVPEHMREDAEYFGSFLPQHYEEAECTHCRKPIYRYKMDLIVEWKHFNHITYCSTLRAQPVTDEAKPL